jgi:hypothetical protein
MILGWLITKTHSSGLTEVFSKQYKGSYCMGYFSRRISEYHIFRNRSDVEEEFKNYTTDISESYEIVPVEAYF